jgi:hypothetical protein
MAQGSHHELEQNRSKPYLPYHPHTRSLSIAPGEVIQYASDLRMTSNIFFGWTQDPLEISADQVKKWYHLPHMDVVEHTVYCDEPAVLLLLP